MEEEKVKVKEQSCQEGKELGRWHMVDEGLCVTEMAIESPH